MTPVMFYDPSGKFPLLTLLIVSGVLVFGGATLGAYGAYQNGTNIMEGVGKGALIGSLLAVSIGLTIGSFFVTGGIGSNLGLMMFTYGINTGLNMIDVGVNQIKYSVSKGDAWTSNITNAMYANSSNIYLNKLIPKALPFAQHFTWHIGEKYSYTIPDEGGLFNDYYDVKESRGLFKDFLRTKPTLLSYGSSALTIGFSTYNLIQSVLGTPRYDRWILY